jgi:SAM-dependent methyltransferase
MSSANPTQQAQRDDPERFDPEAAPGRLIEAEHRARYWTAAALADGRRVLDAGCGTGYGAEILRDAGAASVSAFDLADVAVQRTRERLGDDADVRVADIHALPYDDGSYDLVVCFEVLEHVTEQPQAIAELKRVLAADGVLVISSPNPKVYPSGNPHHVHELTPDELHTLLETTFGHVATAGQHTNLASTVRDADGGAAGAPPRLLGAPPDADDATYTLAVASDTAVPLLTPQTVLASDAELRWYASHLAEVEAARDQEIRRLLAEVDHARSLYEEARDQRAALNAALMDLEARNAVLADFERRYAEVRAERLAYEQDVQRVLAEKDAQIAAATAPRSSLPFRAGRRVRWIVQRSLRRLR